MLRSLLNGAMTGRLESIIYKRKQFISSVTWMGWTMANIIIKLDDHPKTWNMEIILYKQTYLEISILTRLAFLWIQLESEHPRVSVTLGNPIVTLHLYFWKVNHNNNEISKDECKLINIKPFHSQSKQIQKNKDRLNDPSEEIFNGKFNPCKIKAQLEELTS